LVDLGPGLVIRELGQDEVDCLDVSKLHGPSKRSLQALIRHQQVARLLFENDLKVLDPEHGRKVDGTLTSGIEDINRCSIFEEGDCLYSSSPASV
jgi:hypothetical protein